TFGTDKYESIIGLGIGGRIGSWPRRAAVAVEHPDGPRRLHGLRQRQGRTDIQQARPAALLGRLDRHPAEPLELALARPGAGAIGDQRAPARSPPPAELVDHLLQAVALGGWGAVLHMGGQRRVFDRW